MLTQVSAHGFDLTPELKAACETQADERLAQLSQKSLKTKWILSLERQEQVAHLIWDDGVFHGDITVKTTDMYNSISQCAKKAAEQMKKSHDKKQNHHKEDRKDRDLVDDN